MFSFSLEIVPFVEFAGLIILIIVSCLVYRSNKSQGDKKNNIALHVYTIYFIPACLYYLFLVCRIIIYYWKNYSDSIYKFYPNNYIYKNIAAFVYLFEIGIEITTLYLLCVLKKNLIQYQIMNTS